MSEKQFNPDQPRDELGRWSAEGAGVAADADADASAPKNGKTTFIGDMSIKDQKAFIASFAGGSSHEDIANVTGSPSDANFEIATDDSGDGGYVVFISIKHPDFRASRNLIGFKDGSKIIWNDSIEVRKTGRGLGTGIFAKQVKHASAAGVSTIQCMAVRGPTSNGYSTWPKLGYDCALDDDFFKGFGPDAAKKFSKCKSVLDILDTPGGLKWWEDHGTTIPRAVFDLKEGSRSRKVLEAYLKKREERKSSSATTNKKTLTPSGQIVSPPVDHESPVPAIDAMIPDVSRRTEDMDLTLLARDADIARRRDLAPCFDLIVPMAGITKSLDDHAFAQATKSFDTFVVDGKTMTVDSVVSDESRPDRSKEVVLLDGLDIAAYKQVPLGCFLHNRNAPVSLYQDPSTKQCTLTRVGKQLRGREYFAQKGPFAAIAEQVFQLHENGLLRGKSIGFIARWDDYKRIPEDPGQPYGPATTTIQKSSLFEISSVFVPDNDRSLVTEVVRKGLGSKPLMPALFQLFAPFADQEKAWANGWSAPEGTAYDGQQGAKSMSAATTIPPDTTVVGAKGDFEKCCAKGCEKAYSKFDGDEGMCPGCAVRTLKGKIGEMAATVNEAASQIKMVNDLKTKADNADWYEKAFGRDLDIGTKLYKDEKPTGAVLRATHDMAMFAAAASLVSMKGFEGTAERVLYDAAAAYENIAAKCLRDYQLQFPDSSTEWSTVRSLDVYEGVNEGGSESVKAMIGRTAEWAVRFKGWGRAQTVRCQDAAEVMRNLADKTDSGLNEEARKSLREQAKSLESLADENGKCLSMLDRKTDELVGKLEAKLKDLEVAVELGKRKLKEAKGGLRPSFA